MVNRERLLSVTDIVILLVVLVTVFFAATAALTYVDEKSFYCSPDAPEARL